jgi:hypothetical protein
MKIVLQPEESITIDDIEILAVRDIFHEKKIIARIKKLPKGLVLWSGDDEYTAAGNWTNATALARATEVLAGSAINWEF